MFNQINLSIMRKIMFIFAMSLMTVACSDRNEDVISAKESNNNVENLNYARPPGSVNIGIFEVTIHRASKGCTSGFGFCKFTWFPPSSPKIPKFEMPDIPPSEDVTEGRRTVDVYQNEEGVYFFDVYATESLGENVDDLIVDYDLIAVKEGEMTEDLTITAGAYSFDSTLGEYGGYRIILD